MTVEAQAERIVEELRDNFCVHVTSQSTVPDLRQYCCFECSAQRIAAALTCAVAQETERCIMVIGALRDETNFEGMTTALRARGNLQEPP